MLVIIPEGGGTNFRGIGLMEVMWKAISRIINCQLFSSIHFYDVLHSFFEGRGTGTPSPESKLLQNLISMRETVLHSIFMNLCKSYDYLDTEHFLDILAGYVVGPRTIRILRTYWAQFQMAAKERYHYGPIFHIHRGVAKGGPCYPRSWTWFLTLLS